MHTDLRFQPAIGIVALDAECRALDAGDITAADFHQFGLPAAVLAPAQVHPQQHFGPVLRLGAAGAGLDVHETIGAVEFARKHPPELELLDAGCDFVDVFDDGKHGAFVIVGLGHVEQFRGFDESIGIEPDFADGLFQRRAFLAQRLRPLGLVPDGGVFQLAADFFESLYLAIEVKDTPGANRVCS